MLQRLRDERPKAGDNSVSEDAASCTNTRHYLEHTIELKQIKTRLYQADILFCVRRDNGIKIKKNTKTHTKNFTNFSRDRTHQNDKSWVFYRITSLLSVLNCFHTEKWSIWMVWADFPCSPWTLSSTETAGCVPVAAHTYQSHILLIRLKSCAAQALYTQIKHAIN